MSDGDIISIPTYGLPAIGYTGDEIRAQFVYFKDYADEQRGKLDEAIGTLMEIVGNYDPQVADVDILVPTIDAPGFPSAPQLPAIIFDDYPDAPTGEPILMPYPDLNFEYVAPTPPAEISAEWNWSVEDYTSVMWEALFNKVHGDIINGGTGLTDAVHSAIVAREQEARRINQDREYQQGLDAVGAQGFNLPSGHVASFQAEFQREMLRRDQDAVNNLAIKDFDLATENTRFAVTTGVELEKLLRTTWEAANRMGLEATTAMNNYIVAVYEANIKLYMAAWEGIKIELDALKMQVDAIVAYNDGQVKTWLGQAEIYKTNVQAVVAANEGLIDVRQSEIDVYKTEVQAIAVQYEALVAEAELAIKGSALEIEQAIANSRIDLEGYMGETGLAAKVAESQANIAAQAIASALGAMNVGMSQGYSSGESRSESWSHGESLSESHGFSEA